MEGRHYRLPGTVHVQSRREPLHRQLSLHLFGSGENTAFQTIAEGGILDSDGRVHDEGTTRSRNREDRQRPGNDVSCDAGILDGLQYEAISRSRVYA